MSETPVYSELWFILLLALLGLFLLALLLGLVLQRYTDVKGLGVDRIDNTLFSSIFVNIKRH